MSLFFPNQLNFSDISSFVNETFENIIKEIKKEN